MNGLSRLRFAFSQAYKILGITPNCTIEQVKTAYYRKAQILHPDKNPDSNAKERFSEINRAYQEICATHKNKQAGGTTTTYSTYQSNASATWTASANAYKTAQQSEYAKNAREARSDDYYNDFMHEIFDRIRKSKQKAKQAREKEQRERTRQEEEFEMYGDDLNNPKKGAKKKEYQQYREKQSKSKASLDIYAKVQVTPEELVKGCTKEFTIKKTVQCECKKNQGNCKICKGNGFVLEHLQGYGKVEQMCFKCHGTGKARINCKACRGRGIISVQVLEKLKIPKKTEANTTLKFEGKGKRSSNRSGDLYVKIVTAIKGERIKDDIHSKQDISVAEAVLGTEIIVETLFGKKTLDIPRGVKQGELITLSGYGYEREKGKNGNHYITINIKIPQTLNHREQELYQELLSMQRRRARVVEDED